MVVKIPKWQFEKFPGADESLGPQMKSVGEVMAIGRTFKEALLKGVRSLETGKTHRLGEDRATHSDASGWSRRIPSGCSYIRYALRAGHDGEARLPR